MQSGLAVCLFCKSKRLVGVDTILGISIDYYGEITLKYSEVVVDLTRASFDFKIKRTQVCNTVFF